MLNDSRTIPPIQLPYTEIPPLQLPRGQFPPRAIALWTIPTYDNCSLHNAPRHFPPRTMALPPDNYTLEQ